jgi:hypothetical protein
LFAYSSKEFFGKQFTARRECLLLCGYVMCAAALREDRQAELAPNGYTTGFANTGQFLCISEVGSHPHSLSVNTYLIGRKLN